MARRKPNLDELLTRLEYQFERPELLEEALTHVSAPNAGGQSYQRLEFLGDRVLGLAIAEMLYRAFPGAPEGELSRRLAELVRRESCAEIAQSWDVGPHVKLGAGEAQSGERKNEAILADVCEAIIGAVFLDGGYDAAQKLIERSFKDLLAAPRRPLRDPKSALQEWAQAQGLPPPTYTIVEQTGPDHAPRFRVMVKVKGQESDFGLGPSKRVAEQAAARSLLLREGIWTEEEHGVA
ncbi:ribonuclease III [Microvirga aerophila]|uniref:Ribonuclease 3 n=1 Tax=Microvirga aerophila TaxID=670291 RepID=A0A512BYU4_9HYPH|nr:ribonuclease III [Microvirga aerophila]GEO17134.1 ribonuclease 3 [Microvirga aerophila]